MFKTLFCASLLSFGILSASAANANAKEGDICNWSLRQYSIPKFRCYSLFDRQPVALSDIYEQGYRVVAISRADEFVTIAIEKQK